MKQFTIKICIATAMLIMVGNTWAQEDRSKTEFRFNMGYDFSLKGEGSGSFSFEPEFGWNLTDQFYFGLATGLIADDGFDNLSIPALAHFEVNLNPMGSITPYVGIMGGYAFSTEESDYNCGVINPQVGIKLPIGKTTEFIFGVGYTHTFNDGAGGDALGVKLGLGFGGEGRGLSEFWKKCDKSIEVEMYTGVESSCSSVGASQYIAKRSTYYPYTVTYKEELSSFFGLRYSLLFPLFNHCYIGPTLGIGMSKFSHSLSYTYESEIPTEYAYEVSDWDNEEENRLTATAMLRAKYEIEQLTFADKFYPFVQVEGGGILYDWDSDVLFAFNPAIGLSYKLGSGNTLDLTLSYSTLSLDDVDYTGDWRGEYENDGSNGCFRIALGFSW